MAVYPNAHWVGCSKDNYSPAGITHKRVVIHVAQGAAQGTINWFNNPNAQVSAHFLNPKHGPIIQFVDTAQTAWHCAQFNGESIGIEHEGFTGEHLTANQKSNLRALLEWIRKTHGTPLTYTVNPNASGVIGHGKLPEGPLSHPNCPGDNILLDVEAVLKSIHESDLVLAKRQKAKSAAQKAPSGASPITSVAATNAAISSASTPIKGPLA